MAAAGAVERLAEDVRVRLLARLAMVLFLPTLGIMWGTVSRVTEQVELQGKAIIALTGDLNTHRSLQEIKLQEARTVLELRLATISDRNNLQEQRIQRIEGDLYRFRGAGPERSPN